MRTKTRREASAAPAPHARGVRPLLSPGPRAAIVARSARTVSATPPARYLERARSLGHRWEGPSPPIAREAGEHALVRRKIGFEFELADDWDLDRGTPRPVNETTPLIEQQRLRSEGVHGIYWQVPMGRHFQNTDQWLDRQRVTKGETILTGDGWRVTPDGGGTVVGGYYAEFITDPVDETTEPERLPEIMGDLVGAITGWGGHLNDIQHLAKGYLLYVSNAVARAGSVHVTGGIKLSRIIELLESVGERNEPASPWSSSSDSDEDVEPELSADNLLGRAARRAKTKAGASYQGLVALVGSYVSGQQTAEAAPRTAKLRVPALARTNLGAIRGKIAELGQLPPLNTFLNDVLEAAEMGWGQRNERLFPHGLGEGHPARSIDAHPDVSIRDWVLRLYQSSDYTWSETRKSSGGAFGFEDVGLSRTEMVLCCIPWTTREQGAVLELRDLRDAHDIPFTQWTDYANGIAQVFKTLNEA